MEEREYLLHERSNFEETRVAPVITLDKFDVSAQFVGNLNGVWKCMLVYDSDRDQSTSVDVSPEWLLIADSSFTKPEQLAVTLEVEKLLLDVDSKKKGLHRLCSDHLNCGSITCRSIDVIVIVSALKTVFSVTTCNFCDLVINPKMEFIPTLANDLCAISESALNVKFRESSGRSTTEENGGNDIKSHQLEKKSHVPFLDLNSLPCSDSDTEENDQNGKKLLENKKRRAAKTEDIARLSLEDLAKYFDLPIVEASKKLKVGVTALKKKCREFGIPRWPRRKIKSLDNLILDLQKEVQRQHEEDELAATTVEERKRMIEYERESIEKKPFMDIQEETKKFRQNMFKRRHKARVLENQRQKFRCYKVSDNR
ncbi:hypothetical protein RND71_012002 [Anisodus tanguticus]|uniref:RWP-RK domain-containing protein n=1 Tax=Anisodus tanguticus TaxID=243964 RepID=A0AAE1SEC6_9SOLA|nr:hypothetical protein RND71_012002 [Anisodus tanguticus]